METLQGFIPVAAPSPPMQSCWGLDVRVSNIISIQTFKSIEEYKTNSKCYFKREYDCKFFEDFTLNFDSVCEIGLDIEVHGNKYFIVHPEFNTKMKHIANGLNAHMYQFFTILQHAPRLMEYAKDAMDSAEKDYNHKEKNNRMKRTRE